MRVRESECVCVCVRKRWEENNNVYLSAIVQQLTMPEARSLATEMRTSQGKGYSYNEKGNRSSKDIKTIVTLQPS